MPDSVGYGTVPALALASVILYDVAVSRSSKDMLLARLMAARWLGAGRATEAYLSLTSFIAAVLLLWVPNTFGFAFGAPLLVKSMLSGGGLVLNILGSSWARYLRFSGGLIGGIIWTRILIEVGDTKILSGGCDTASESLLLVVVAFCVTSIIFSAREMAMALADIPHSGIGNGMARE